MKYKRVVHVIKQGTHVSILTGREGFWRYSEPVVTTKNKCLTLCQCKQHADPKNEVKAVKTSTLLIGSHNEYEQLGNCNCSNSIYRKMQHHCIWEGINFFQSKRTSLQILDSYRQDHSHLSKGYHSLG
jgi:hypothetical protein